MKALQDNLRMGLCNADEPAGGYKMLLTGLG
jgi:hypothetical protein